MRLIRVFGLAAALAACLAVSASAQSRLQDLSPADAMIEGWVRSARFAAANNDAPSVLMSLERALGDDIFPLLSGARRKEVAELYAYAALEEGEWKAAQGGFIRLTQETPGDLNAWVHRMHAAISAGDGADAYVAFDHLASRGQPVLSTFDADLLDHFDQLLRTQPDALKARLSLGRELVREGWAPFRGYQDGSRLWLHYAEALLASGDERAAAAAAARITDPIVIMAIQTDRRFDAIVAATPGLQDPHAVAVGDLAAAEAFLEVNPRRLSGRLAKARALGVLGREGEAEPMLGAAARAVATAPHTRPPFDDMGLENALKAWRASALLSLGRVDEAIGVQTNAVSCNCSSYSLVALTRTLVKAGRTNEAREWLQDAPTRGLGPVELMELAQVKACAAAQVDDRAALDSAMEYLAGHERWQPAALVDALVCANRMDLAEAALKRQLADSGMRLEALARLQSYAPPPSPTAFEALMEKRWVQLAASPTLRVEIAKVGRQKQFDLRRWGSIS